MCKLRHGDIAGSVNSHNYRVAYRRFLRYSSRDDRRLPIIPLNWQSDWVQARLVCRWIGSAKWERNREIKEPTGGRGSSLGGIIKRVSWVATVVNPRPVLMALCHVRLANSIRSFRARFRHRSTSRKKKLSRACRDTFRWDLTWDHISREKWNPKKSND